MATTFVDSAALRDRRPWLAAATVSLLLHAMAAWWLLGAPWWRELPPEPPAMVIEVVTLAPEPPPPPPPVASAPPLPTVPAPPPPLPSEAPIAERSVPPPSPNPQPVRRPDSTAAAPAPRGAPPLPRSERGQPAPPESGRVQPSGTPQYETATRTVQDIILNQVLERWIIDYRAPKFRGIEVGWRFTLLPDGTLTSPLGPNDPMDMRRIIGNYDELLKPGYETVRVAAETFIQAVRQAQPFRLPPDAQANEPRFLPLSFRLGDL